mmetsp:Transcript_28152/g.38704  ORF Transcript_28152/g.38704 Transcript_28152/m.38704 type:complete len:430 (+) Transcript_28152:77-1366(+)
MLFNEIHTEMILNSLYEGIHSFNAWNYPHNIVIFAVIAAVFLLIAIYLIKLRFDSSEKWRLNDLRNCWKDIEDLVEKKNCNPILLRLAWSDAVTFDCHAMRKEWPYCGGVNGSIRFDSNLDLVTNAGLSKAIDLLTPIKWKYRSISWADLIQMAGVVAIYKAGGPKIHLNYGRLDMTIETHRSILNNTIPRNDPSHFISSNHSSSHLNKDTTPTTKKSNPSLSSLSSSSTATTLIRRLSFNNNKTIRRSSPKMDLIPPVLPCPFPPYPDGAPTADVHIRNVFYRLGFNNKEIVALCGAHTLGRAFKDRTGACMNTIGDQGATIYTSSTSIARADGQPGIGMAGGASWTPNWLHFDNSYYTCIMKSCTGSDDPNLLKLPTDMSLYECPEFRRYFVRFAQNKEEFFREYAIAHKKMSELGAKFSCVLNLDM